MNRVIISGQLVEEPKLGRNVRGNWFVNFWLEVKLPFNPVTKQNPTADFPVHARSKLAHHIKDNFHALDKISFVGHLENIYSDIQGQTVERAVLVIDNIE